MTSVEVRAKSTTEAMKKIRNTPAFKEGVWVVVSARPIAFAVTIRKRKNPKHKRRKKK